jgi:type IV pilus assembly protein PilQ
MRWAISLVHAVLLRHRRPLGRWTHVASVAVVAGALGAARSASADGEHNHVRDVRIEADDGVPGGAKIDITGADALTYSVRVADGGSRLLVDLSDTDVAGAPSAITKGVGVVGGVLTQSFPTSAGGSMTRVTVNLLKGATYRVVPQGPNLQVLVAPSGDPGKSAGSAVPPAQLLLPTATVRDVKFERSAATAPGCAPFGCDRVVVDLGSIPPYSLSTSADGNLRLDLKATSLPEALARTLDVSAYRGPLNRITASFDAATATTTLEIDRAGDAPAGTVSVDGGLLVWSFATPRPIDGASAVVEQHLDGRAVGKDGGAVRHVVTVAREERPADLPRIETSIHDEDPPVETSTGGAAGFVGPSANVLAQQRYTGRRIDIDLKDADIHNVLRLLADTGHINIVTADDVSGTITIRMRNVPWDQVLDVVLQAKGLGMVRQGNLVRVAPLAQLQKERELKLAAQKQEYELTPLETRLIPISYAQADELQARAKELLSPRGSLAVDERTNVLIARDISSNLNYIEELVRSLDTQTAQVLIEARIVEATSSYNRDIGIQWGGDVTYGAATGNPTGVAFPSSLTAAGGNYDNQTPTAGISPFTRTIATPNFAVNLPAAVGTGAGGAIGMSFGSIDNALNLSVRLSAAESAGLVRIVSAPRVMVLDNKEARINQGTLIPYAQVSALGVQTTFQEAKLQLLVKPHVTADGSVSMHVKVNRDEPNFNQTAPNGAPTILKREAETELLVMDGHTAVIGGIYTRNTGRNLSQVPFFGDIPILGVLFQHRTASDARNELIIFLTPRIVNRAEALGR